MFEMMLLALTMNIFMESQGEGQIGMEATADTTIVRVQMESYPDNVYDVVMQKSQFSWVAENKVRSWDDLVALQIKVLDKAAKNPKTLAAYKTAEKVARKALETGYKPKHYYTHFHSIAVYPKWARGRYGRPIGRHVYYRIVK